MFFISSAPICGPAAVHAAAACSHSSTTRVPRALVPRALVPRAFVPRARVPTTLAPRARVPASEHIGPTAAQTSLPPCTASFWAPGQRAYRETCRAEGHALRGSPRASPKRRQTCRAHRARSVPGTHLRLLRTQALLLRRQLPEEAEGEHRREEEGGITARRACCLLRRAHGGAPPPRSGFLQHAGMWVCHTWPSIVRDRLRAHA